MLGVIADTGAAVPVCPTTAGAVLCLIGADTRPGLGGSEYLWTTTGRVAGRPPAIDLAEERRLQDLLVATAGDGLLHSAHDVATGGLLTTLVEVCGDTWGADIDAASRLPPHQWLFSESPSRVVVAVDPTRVDELQQACDTADLACQRLGVVTDDRRLGVGEMLELELDSLAVARARVFAALFDAAERAAEAAAAPMR